MRSAGALHGPLAMLIFYLSNCIWTLSRVTVQFNWTVEPFAELARCRALQPFFIDGKQPVAKRAGTIHLMYQPPQFQSSDRALAARLMRDHPFASLVTNDDDGFPFVSHLPLHLEDRAGTYVLLGHCAKAN